MEMTIPLYVLAVALPMFVLTRLSKRVFFQLHSKCKVGSFRRIHCSFPVSVNTCFASEPYSLPMVSLEILQSGWFHECIYILHFVAGSSRSILDTKKDTPFRFWAIVAGIPGNRKQASFLQRSTDHITFMIRKKKYNFLFQNLSNHSLIQSNHGRWYYYWINHTRPT